MMNSFLKPALTETHTIISEEGEILEQDIKTVKYLAHTKEEFYIIYSSLIGLLQQMSLPEVRVYCYLLQNYNCGTEIGLPKAIKQIMAEKQGLKLGTVDNVLGTLVKKRVLYSTQRGVYKLNPRYAFQGATKERNAMLKVVLELECPDC